jgi:hypothetical protein
LLDDPYTAALRRAGRVVDKTLGPLLGKVDLLADSIVEVDIGLPELLDYPDRDGTTPSIDSESFAPDINCDR